MSVYEAVRVYKEKSVNISQRLNINSLLKHICCLGLSLLFSLSGFSNGFSPFGVAFAGAVSYRYTLTAVAGSVAGYFIALESVPALRYTSSVLALAVIMLALKSLKKVNSGVKLPASVTFICLLTTGLAITFSKGFSLPELLINICEAALGGGISYVFYKTRKYFCTAGGLKTLTSREITFVVISIAVLLLSFRYVNIFSVSFANIISVFLCLLCSFYGREAGGAVVGVCCGISRLLSVGDLFLLSFYSLGGLLSGVLSSFGRIFSLVAFVFSGVIIYVASGSTENIAHLIAETAVGSLIFFAVSFRYNYQLEGFFTPAVSSNVINSVKSSIINKLQKASDFSNEICVTLDNVNEALSKSDKTDFDNIPLKAKESVCFGCGLYDTCWNEQKTVTQKNFNDLLALKKQGEYLQYKTVPQAFASACIRTENVSDSFNKLFSEYKLREKTENRIKEIQGLASEQFTNVSDLLLSLCDEINEDIRFDMDVATRCRAAALSLNLQVLDSSCIYDSAEKATIELRLKKPFNDALLSTLNKLISSASGKALEEPQTDDFNEYIRILYKEKAELKTVFSVAQFNAPGEKYSGDSYTVFTDNKGYFYAAICDGMGTGTTAAVTSGLAVTLLEKLVKAGFSIESAVNTVNTSLISKSGEECSVTLDLVCIDLYTGRAELYKCGAQDSLLKHRGKLTNVNTSSLPLGIISNIEVGTLCCNLNRGDVLILCSDGVREEDFYHLRNALKVFENGDVKSFTADISNTVRRSQPEKKDDFTLITIAIENNR